MITDNLTRREYLIGDNLTWREYLIGDNLTWSILLVITLHGVFDW